MGWAEIPKDKKVKYMSPDDFMESTRKESMDRIMRSGRTKGEEWVFESPKKYEEVIIHKPTVKRWKRGIKSPKGKMSVPYLEFRDGIQIGHEGRHRAIAAREAGLKKMPVIIYDWKWKGKLESKGTEEGEPK